LPRNKQPVYRQPTLDSGGVLPVLSIVDHLRAAGVFREPDRRLAGTRLQDDRSDHAPTSAAFPEAIPLPVRDGVSCRRSPTAIPLASAHPSASSIAANAPYAIASRHGLTFEHTLTIVPSFATKTTSIGKRMKSVWIAAQGARTIAASASSPSRRSNPRRRVV